MPGSCSQTWTVFLVVLVLLHCSGQSFVQAGELFCTRHTRHGCKAVEELDFTRIDESALTINHTWTLQADEGRLIHPKVVNLEPLVIVTPDFLSSEECDHVIKLSQSQGLHSSATMAELELKALSHIPWPTPQNDDKIPLDDVIQTLRAIFDAALSESDVRTIFQELTLPVNDDDTVGMETLSEFSLEVLTKAVRGYVKKHPHKQTRISKQAWLHPEFSGDEVIENLKTRLSVLSGMPVRMFSTGTMQVVRYGVGGRYMGHYDSAADENFGKPKDCCSAHAIDEHCNVCRYLTLLVYLNDVEEGGETAFPLANYEEHEEETISPAEIDLEVNCSSASLVVQPERGKAILWYNHFPDPYSGGLGDLDPLTMHGGCPVIRGEKWIANFWVTVFNVSTESAKLGNPEVEDRMWGDGTSGKRALGAGAETLEGKLAKINARVVEEIRKLQREQRGKEGEAGLGHPHRDAEREKGQGKTTRKEEL